jgi:hypothetical protein
MGTTCDPQLRLVSRSFRDLLAAVSYEDLRIEDFLSSLRLFLWARDELSFDYPALTLAVKAARGSHVKVLEWLRDKQGAWTTAVCESAASAGHVHVLIWLRAQDLPCPWDVWTCARAAQHGHLEGAAVGASPGPALSLGRIDMCWCFVWRRVTCAAVGACSGPSLSTSR